MRHDKFRRRDKPEHSNVIRFETVSRQRRKAKRAKRVGPMVLVVAVLAGALLGIGSLFATGNAPQMLAAVGLARGGDCSLVSVHDGDTIRCNGEKIRLANIDAPELEGSPRCVQMRYGKNPSWCDFELGIKSRDALDDFLDSGSIKVERVGVDRYGRTLATISVDGADAGRHLISLGYAKAWVD